MTPRRMIWLVADVTRSGTCCGLGVSATHRPPALLGLWLPSASAAAATECLDCCRRRRLIAVVFGPRVQLLFLFPANDLIGPPSWSRQRRTEYKINDTSPRQTFILSNIIYRTEWSLAFVCFNFFFILFLFLATCTRSSWSHSAFESTLYSSILSYPDLFSKIGKYR